MEAVPVLLRQSPRKPAGHDTVTHDMLMKLRRNARIRTRPARLLWETHGTRTVDANSSFMPVRLFLCVLILLIGCFLTACVDEDRNASWRQRKIAVVSFDGKKMGISVMNADGSKKVFITPRYRAVGYPALSPDGKQIAFIENYSTGYLPDGEEQVIHIVNSDGSGLVSLMETSRLRNKDGLAWSPDGTKLAFAAEHWTYQHKSRTDIYVYDVRTSQFTNLTGDAHREVYRNSDPTWSPDGQRLAFISDRRDWESRAQIFVINADGSQPRQVTTIPLVRSCWGPCGPISPRWSSDGTKLAYTLAGISSPEHREVHVVPVDGSGDILITSSGGMDEQPAWSPDGMRLAFASFRGGWPAIYLVNVDGSGLVPLTKHEDYAFYPQWLPGEEKIVFVRGGELYLMNSDGTRQIRLNGSVATREVPFHCAPR